MARRTPNVLNATRRRVLQRGQRALKHLVVPNREKDGDDDQRENPDITAQRDEQTRERHGYSNPTQNGRSADMLVEVITNRHERRLGLTRFIRNFSVYLHYRLPKRGKLHAYNYGWTASGHGLVFSVTGFPRSPTLYGIGVTKFSKICVSGNLLFEPSGVSIVLKIGYRVHRDGRPHPQTLPAVAAQCSQL